jgi:fumarate hydratase, class I
VTRATTNQVLRWSGPQARPWQVAAFTCVVVKGATVPEFEYEDLLPQGTDQTTYRLLTSEGVRTVAGPDGREFLEVAPEALRLLTETAMHDIAHYLRPAHLTQLRSIIDDPQASNNDKFVALDLLKNANIAAGGVLPMCQDTGTAIVMGKRGQQVLTEGGSDESSIARGVYDAYTRLNLRYSQMAPITMWEERNTGSNLPAQIELYADTAAGHETTYKFLFMAKGGGSANKSYLYQETKAVLNPESMITFLDEKLRSLGTAACPPYHLAIVIGGTSAEFALKTAKYASAKYLDGLPREGSASTARGFRDVELEAQVLELTRNFGIGAQFGGKYFCHDVRVIRLPRHGASLPIAIAVSCSADRQALGKITPEGVFIEELETDPARFLPETTEAHLAAEDAGHAEASPAGDDVVKVDLTRPMDEIRAELTKYPVMTRLSLTGTLVVARDLAHAKIKVLLDAGEPMPQYLKDHPVYYAGPAKTPEGYASGSFGPTTAGRMDSYVEQFQAAGGSMVMLAKGNRSGQVTAACALNGGFYLGSIGGPAARLAQDCIRSVEVLEYPELGMEAIWKIEVEDFPAFIVVDDKGNDFYAETAKPLAMSITKRPGL